MWNIKILNIFSVRIYIETRLTNIVNPDSDRVFVHFVQHCTILLRTFLFSELRDCQGDRVKRMQTNNSQHPCDPARRAIFRGSNRAIESEHYLDDVRLPFSWWERSGNIFVPNSKEIVDGRPLSASTNRDQLPIFRASLWFRHVCEVFA